MRIAGGEVLARGGIPEGLVWSDTIVVVFPRQERLLEDGQVERALITLPELTPGRAIEPFDPSIELGTAGRQHVERDLAILTRLLELGHELRAPIVLNRLYRNRHARDQIIEEGARRPRRGGRPDPDHGPPRHHINGGELAPLDAWERAQVHGVELDQRARHGRLAFGLGHLGGIGADRTAAPDPHGMGFHQEPTSPQTGQDASDHRGAEDDATRRQ